MKNEKGNQIDELSFKFALDIVKYAHLLEKENNQLIARQILFCGTSIGFNIREAHKADLKQDYSHKIRIAKKEADELDYLLMICKESDGFPNCDKLLESLEVLTKSLTGIIGDLKRQIGFTR
jgi:four helix bundle protein